MYDHTFVPDSKRYPMHYNTPEEEQMREGFIQAATTVSGEEELYRKDGSTLLAGIELELAMLTSDYKLATQHMRDSVIKAVPNTSVELSAHQLEVVPATPADLKHDLLSLENAMTQAVASIQLVTRQMGLSWLRMGSYPLCHIHEVDYTKGEPKYIKYERSPQWHMANQRPSLEKYILTATGPLDVSSGYIVGLMNALQVTVDSINFNDAIDKLNRSFMISPMTVALAAHASHLGYLNTRYSDVRFVTWRISHDTRTNEEVDRGFPTRVGLPAHYATGLNDYFNQILSYPFVMNDLVSLQYPFEVGNGIFWRDARLKFFRDKKTIGIEFRPVSIQPTLHEDISVILFYIGRLLWSQHVGEQLLPMDLVWENKENAMSLGMQAKLHTQINGKIVLLPATQAMGIEIERAEQGLALLESDVWKRLYFINTIRERIEGGSPAERFVKTVNPIARTIEEAGQNLIDAIEKRNLVER